MSLIGGQSRQQLRGVYVEAWRKAREGLPLSPLEAMIGEVIELHPEYQRLLADPEAALAFEPEPDARSENPFLHMGLHIAVREQLSIDRPVGIRAAAARLAARDGEHACEHALMRVLAQILHESRQTGGAADEAEYLSRVRRLAQA